VAEAFIGEIRMFSFNFAPRDWAKCDGQLLSINQNQALFSLLGTTYGGNGQTTFALPDLRGRTPIHTGQGPGLSPRVLGQVYGEEAHTLTVNEMPAHLHTLQAAAAPTDKMPAGALIAQGGAKLFRSGAPIDVTLAPAALATSGSSQSHPNMQPYAVVNFAICLFGLFPSRN
jgi:microcystin-dependent protein